MNEKIVNFNREYNSWKEEYINIPKIKLYNFLKSNDIDILKKLDIEIENRVYSEYEYHLIEMNLYEYYEEKNNRIKQTKELKKRGVEKKEYEEILNIFNKISSYYNL